MKRICLVRVLGVFSLAAACGDDGAVADGDTDDSSSGDEADGDVVDDDDGPTTVDTTDGESSSSSATVADSREDSSSSDSGDLCGNDMDSPGCDDDSCVEFICGFDPFCCDESWDDVCSGNAATGCAACNPGVCGNNLVDAVGEVCDGVDVGGEDCASQGFDVGNLACAGNCSGLDTSGCF